MTGSRPATPAPAAVRAELTRKALHLSTAIVPIAAARDWISPESLRVGVLWLGGVAIAAELLRQALPGVRTALDRRVGRLYRPHEHRGVLGATWLALAMAGAVVFFPERAAIAALWAVAVGDAAAALVGRGILRREGKSWAGSVACLAATALGAWWLAGARLPVAFVIGVAAAIAERPRSVIDDNLRVTAAAGFAAWMLDVA